MRKMFGRFLRFFKRTDYREGSYQHRDLSPEVGPAWHLRLRLQLTNRGGVDTARTTPGFWLRHRRWLVILLALGLAWLVAESALAWNFFEG